MIRACQAPCFSTVIACKCLVVGTFDELASWHGAVPYDVWNSPRQYIAQMQSPGFQNIGPNEVFQVLYTDQFLAQRIGTRQVLSACGIETLVFVMLNETVDAEFTSTNLELIKGVRFPAYGTCIVRVFFTPDLRVF